MAGTSPRRTSHYAVPNRHEPYASLQGLDVASGWPYIAESRGGYILTHTYIYIRCWRTLSSVNDSAVHATLTLSLKAEELGHVADVSSQNDIRELLEKANPFRHVFVIVAVRNFPKRVPEFWFMTLVCLCETQYQWARPEIPSRGLTAGRLMETLCSWTGPCSSV